MYYSGEDIQKRRLEIRDNIAKSMGIEGGYDEIEKARNVGDMHPNGKWAWTEYKPGKFDWRVAKKSGKMSKNSKEKPSKRISSSFKTYDEVLSYLKETLKESGVNTNRYKVNEIWANKDKFGKDNSKLLFSISRGNRNPTGEIYLGVNSSNNLTVSAITGLESSKNLKKIAAKYGLNDISQEKRAGIVSYSSGKKQSEINKDGINKILQSFEKDIRDEMKRQREFYNK